MSLTSQLRSAHSPCRRFFQERLPDLATVRGRWRDAEPRVMPPTPGASFLGTVGTAFDYRVRYHFAVTPPEEFVARSGAHARGRADEYRAFSTALTAAVDRIAPRARVLDAAAEEELASLCYALALFEECRRMGRHDSSPLDRLPPGADVAEVLAVAPRQALDDLNTLMSLFYDSELAAWGDRPVVANPQFTGAGLVGGADGDVILGGCLVDLKVATKPFKPWWAYQLVGYVLLDLEDRYALDQVALYHARAGVLMTWPLQELLDEAAGAPVDRGRLRSDFLDALGESPAD